MSYNLENHHWSRRQRMPDRADHHARRFDVVVRYDDIPESDITSADGIRCTTPLRTMIDIAADHDRTELERMVREWLRRRLFTREEAVARIAEPDMLTRPGAKVLRQILDGATT